jgi:hypothetical protein
VIVPGICEYRHPLDVRLVMDRIMAVSVHGRNVFHENPWCPACGARVGVDEQALAIAKAEEAESRAPTTRDGTVMPVPAAEALCEGGMAVWGVGIGED